MNSIERTSKRLTACVAIVGVVLGLALATAPAAVADTAPVEVTTPPTVSADALPVTQINGVAWTQAVVGTTVYVGGKFTSARPAGAPAGTSETPRGNLLAYDIRTGALIASFAPQMNGQVLGLTASPDGSRLYVVGEFTQVNGVARYRIAAFDLATGQLSPTFRPTVDFRARTVVATASAVYVGGAFNTANNVARTRLAAFSPSNGSLLPWAPSAEGGQVMSMVMTPDQSSLVVGGQFSTVSGIAAYGMARVDATTGAVLPWAATTVVRNAGPNAGIYSLAVDGSQVYGTGYTFGSGGNLEGSFAADAGTGTVAWVNGCRGDTYAAAPVGQALYTVGHAHDCATIGGHPQVNPWTYQRAQAFSTTPAADGRVNLSGHFKGRAAPELLHWLPTLDAGTFTGQDQAAWSVVGSGDYVVLAGEFPRVNGKPQQGLTRFTTRTSAPNAEGPQGYAELAPTLQAVAPGTVRVAWTAAWDRDNRRLTYEVIRNSAVVGTLTADSSWWQRAALVFTDTTAPAGSTVAYRVRVSDPLGNQLSSTTVGTAVPAGTTTSLGYSGAVAADGATSHWRLGEPSGTAAYNWAGIDDLTLAASERGTAGALSGDSDLATTFAGVSGSSAGTTTVRGGPQRFSVEAWVKTTTTQGGKIVGFGSSPSGGSASADRHVYMTNSGQLVFGVSPSTVRTVTSPARYNDGAWHHVVASLGAGGMSLWVDGGQVASRTDTTSAQVFNGYWRVGGDTIGSSWTSRPTSSYLAGSVDEVAVYPTALTAEVIARHSSLGRGVVPNTAPTARFTSSVRDLTAALDGTTSSDRDGVLASYAWTFGDGTVGTGSTASHTYAAAGTYPVTLTVTDDDGATGTVSGSVTVTAPVPNTAPTAAFTSSASGLTASVDGSGSSDADGQIVGWSWSFGDGGTATGASTAHAYAAAGTYPVTLTVTDDDGATTAVTRSVTVTAPPGGPGAFAADSFERTVSGGLGTAEVGGAWTTSGGASSFSVAGGVGRVSLPSAGATRTALLGSVAQTSSDVNASIALDTAQTGGGTYVSVIGRKVDTNDYRLRVRYLATGAVTVQLARAAGSTETVITQTTLPGVTYAAGEVLRVRLQVFGTGTTTMNAKVWRAGTSEPAAWTLTTQDSTATLQSAGSVGLSAYLSGSATAVPMTIVVDDFSARAL